MRDDWKIRKVSPDDDINVIAELIVDTDPYIYRDLFGNEGKAAKVLPYLFNRDTGIFKRSCYYLAFNEYDEVLGIIAFFKNGDAWRPEAVKMAFLEAGAEIPESFDSVSEYFKGAHNYSSEVKACNICVRKKFRRCGVGDYMVKEVIKMAGNSNISLTVLKSNEAAIKLYLNNGFKIIYEFEDYGGYNQPKVTSYFMMRLHSVKNLQLDN